MALPTTQQQIDIAGIYAAFWDRAPDPAGFGYWVDLYANGLDLDTIADAFRDAPEGQQAYPLYLTAEEFVAQVYTNVFDRAPDAAGLAYWTDLLENDGYTEGEVVTLMTNAAQALENDDGALYDNKIEVALWVATNYLSGNATQDQIDVVTSNAFHYVTASASSIDSSVNYISHLPVGTPYTLTVTQDTLNGVAGNDLFIGNLGGSNANTLTLADRLDGGQGVDTLDVTLSGNAYGPFTIQNIERVEIEAAANATITNAFAGVEVIQLEDTNGFGVTVSGLTGSVDEVSVYNSIDASIQVEAATTAAAITLRVDTVDTVTVDVIDVVAGSTTSTLNIVSEGGATTDLTVTGDITKGDTLNVVANADLDFAGLTMAHMTDLSITGAVDLVMTAGVGLAEAATTDITVDATTLLGNLSLDLLNAGGAALTADFGVGDDSFDISANVAGGVSLTDVFMGLGDDTLTVDLTLPGNTNVLLDGGLGLADTLAITGVTNAAALSTIDLDSFGTVQGFETLDITSTFVTLSGSAGMMTIASGIETVDFNATITYSTTGGLEIANADDNLTVDFNTISAAAVAVQPSSVEFNLNIDEAGGALTFNFNADADIHAGASVGNDWSFAQATSLNFNIVDTTSDGDSVSISFGTAGTGTLDAEFVETIAITGGGTLSTFDFDISDIASAGSSLTSFDTIDISGFGGTVTLDLDAGISIENNLTIILGDGFTGAATIATINGSDTTDTYDFAETLTGAVVITNFENNGGFANGDQIDLVSMGITATSQLDVSYDAGFTYAVITSDQFDGSIRVSLNNATALTAGDFIFA